MKEGQELELLLAQMRATMDEAVKLARTSAGRVRELELENQSLRERVDAFRGSASAMAEKNILLIAENGYLKSSRWFPVGLS